MNSYFDNDYTVEEALWYIGTHGLDNDRVYWDQDGISLHSKSLIGRCDDYLAANFHVDGIPALMFKIDGEVWMSLTPMEIQSAAVPLHLAEGVVGTAGLGMGYFPLRAADSESVEKVVVYEQDGRVIDLFRKFHAGRKNLLEKVEIIHGDVREELPKSKVDFDLFWMDPYQTMCPDEVIEDAEKFAGLDNIYLYRFWGQELILLTAQTQLYRDDYPETAEKADALLTYPDRVFFHDFIVHDSSQMFRPMPDENYVERVIDVLYDAIKERE